MDIFENLNNPGETELSQDINEEKGVEITPPSADSIENTETAIPETPADTAEESPVEFVENAINNETEAPLEPVSEDKSESHFYTVGDTSQPEPAFDTVSEPQTEIPFQPEEKGVFLPQSDNTFSPEKIEFNTGTHEMSVKKSSKGLRVFAGILAAVLLLTLSCAVGYNFGRANVDTNGTYSTTSMKVYPKPADTDAMSAQEVYDNVSPSVVGIIAYNSDGDASQASGVVYTDNEYILTNDHIYSSIPSPKFKIYTSTGKTYDAEYVAGDTISDLALLKVKGAKGLKKPEFGDSTKVEFGENVAAIGRPGDARSASSITTGIISNPHRRETITTNYTVNMLQTDCDIFEGSSGGALVNMYGQVIGITSSKSVSDDGASMNFAIPVKTVARVAPQLSSKGKVVDRAKLGISYREVSSLEAELNNLDYYGLYILDVSKDSDLSGKVKEGSVITHINGQKITSANIVLDIIDDSKANDTIKLTIVDSSGNSKDYSVKLKANIGESSYTTEKKSAQELPNNSDDKTFDFPKGE